MHTCPFDEDLLPYWQKRYDFFHQFDQGIRIDAEGLHTVIPEAIALQHAALIPEEHILDGFTGIGGSCIAFARSGKSVISVELDQSRYTMAQHNASIYQVEQHIKFICGDLTHIISNIEANAIYLDPPWGWPSKKQKNTFSFLDFAFDLLNLFKQINFLNQAVYLRAPKTFDIQTIPAPYKANIIQNDVLYDRTISMLCEITLSHI